MERLTRADGLFAVGFVLFDAASAFGLRARPPDAGLPLAWFALVEATAVETLSALPPFRAPYAIGSLQPSLDQQAFASAVARIKGYLRDGDSYQVNYTFRMEAPFEGDAHALFADLVAAQQGRYSAFISVGSYSICSASPELFFSRDSSGVLSARPMKGTAPRGRTREEDRIQADRLRASPKQRAENVMIVDMVRNDLGRIADVGTVEVPELFTVERYPNVWQMTSLVTARSSAPLADVFAALHPSASVTGAPKVRTLEILSELEDRPRGVYTGAIGYLGPDGTAQFNVAIRTALIDHAAQRLSFGIGSGIVWDSDAAEEYEECRLKGSIIGHRPYEFELIETMRWTGDEGFYLIERHWGRLRDSAEYFGFCCDEQAVRTALAVEQAALERAAHPSWRVRLLLSRSGEIRIEHRPLDEPVRIPLEVALAPAPIDANDRFLYHKTTRRETYDRARSAVGPGCDEVVLWNARREVTEAATANVVVELGGERVTPRVTCGLLGGTFRAELLSRGEIREGVVTVEQLASASRFWIINSVHGWRDARLGGGAEEAGRWTGLAGKAGAGLSE